MYYDQPIRTFADDLAAKKPAPGGGSAAGLAGVTGCALLAMVGRFTAGKKKYAEVEEEMVAIIDQVDTLRARLAECIDEDVAEYDKVTQAFALPKSTDEEKAARREAIQQATVAAMRIPLEVCRLTGQALLLAGELIKKGNPNLASDVGVGAQCLITAFRSAWLNVEINLSSLENEDFVAKVRSETDPLITEADKLGVELWNETVRRIRG